MGKPIGYDINEWPGHITAIYYAEANPKDEDIKSLSDGGLGNQDHMARLVESIRKTDAVKKAMNEAHQHVELALKTLKGFEPSLEREALENLAKFIVDRNV